MDLKLAMELLVVLHLSTAAGMLHSCILLLLLSVVVAFSLVVAFFHVAFSLVAFFLIVASLLLHSAVVAFSFVVAFYLVAFSCYILLFLFFSIKILLYKQGYTNSIKLIR